MTQQKQTYVWDIPTRLFHWGLVICVVGAFISGQMGKMTVHEKCGLTVVGLIGFRILWGIFGSKTALFSTFLRSPHAAVCDFLSILRAQKTSRHHGHSPAGGYAVLALLAVPGLLAVTGLFSTNDILFDGPLAHLQPDWIKTATRLHHFFHPVMVGLFILHLAIMVVYWLRVNINLVPAMISGRYNTQTKTELAVPPTRARQTSGLILLAVCIGLAHSLVWLRPSWF